MRKAPQGGLVYSTDSGRMCPGCRQPVAACSCRAATPAPTGDGIVRVGLSTKGRGGKAVTVAAGFGAALDAEALAALGKRLRTACGAGGTVKEDTLEVQGDHVERVLAWLQAEGWKVKRR